VVSQPVSQPLLLTLHCAFMSPMSRPQKITFGEMREMGVRRILVHCASHICSRSIEMDADAWPDATRLSEIED
jgi:hypothetical protein